MGRFSRAKVWLPILLTGLLLGITKGSFVLAGPPYMSYLPILREDSAESQPNILTDGGVVTGVDGVAIGAVVGSLTQSLAVEITQTTAPTLPLPTGTQPLSLYYALSAERTVFANDDTPFILSIPVPPTVATDQLGIALYVKDDDSNVFDWMIRSGLYDPVEQTMLVKLPLLPNDVMQIVLVQNMGLSSPDNNVAHRQQAHVTGAPDFELRCPGDPALYDICKVDKDVFEDELKTNLNEFLNMGYNAPHLETVPLQLTLDPPISVPSNTFVATAYPAMSNCTNTSLGFYIAKAMWINFCFLPYAPLFDTHKDVIRHELFHALQSGYENTRNAMKSGDYEDWIVEGLASTAERSGSQNLVRTPTRRLHFVDTSIMSDQDTKAYAAQDFWVFYGQASDQLSGLPGFIPLFQTGAKTEHVAEWLGGETALGDWYWRWAKNQAMVEENITFDGALGAPCMLQRDVVELDLSFDRNAETSAELEPLSSHVLEFDVSDYLNRRIIVWVLNSNGAQDAFLKYKLYVDGEACTSVPDGERSIIEVFTSQKYYLLISNVSSDTPRTYRIHIE